MAVLMHSFVDFPMQTPAIAAWVFVFLAGVAARDRSDHRELETSGAEFSAIKQDDEPVGAFSGQF